MKEKDVLQINATIITGLFIFVTIGVQGNLTTIDAVVEILKSFWIVLGIFVSSAIASLAGVFHTLDEKNKDSTSWLKVSMVILMIGFIVLFIAMMYISGILYSSPFV